MLSEDDPLFENWDQDASAVADAYEHQVPATVIDELDGAAEAVASQLDRVVGPAWQRTGRRSDGASFEVQTIARVGGPPVQRRSSVAGSATPPK